jgi:hypothetical protein
MKYRPKKAKAATAWPDGKQRPARRHPRPIASATRNVPRRELRQVPGATGAAELLDATAPPAWHSSVTPSQRQAHARPGRRPGRALPHAQAMRGQQQPRPPSGRRRAAAWLVTKASRQAKPWAHRRTGAPRPDPRPVASQASKSSSAGQRDGQVRVTAPLGRRRARWRALMACGRAGSGPRPARTARSARPAGPAGCGTGGRARPAAWARWRRQARSGRSAPCPAGRNHITMGTRFCTSARWRRAGRAGTGPFRPATRRGPRHTAPCRPWLATRACKAVDQLRQHVVGVQQRVVVGVDDFGGCTAQVVFAGRPA